MNYSRRKFFGQSVSGALALASIPAIVSACVSSENKKYAAIQKGGTIVFQGDSITDAGREKENELPNNARSFGNGYAFIAASLLLREMPDYELTIFNRGISGNKVFQLADRWQKDCLELHPTTLSILIGINDYWHKRNGNYSGTVEIYENDYRSLIQRTQDELPNLKLVICQPFAVKNTSVVDDSWMEPVREYQESAKKIADEFGAIWVPFQEVFDEDQKYAPGSYWTADGVHPSMAGAQLMAEAWLKSVE